MYDDMYFLSSPMIKCKVLSLSYNMGWNHQICLQYIMEWDRKQTEIPVLSLLILSGSDIFYISACFLSDSK